MADDISSSMIFSFVDLVRYIDIPLNWSLIMYASIATSSDFMCSGQFEAVQLQTNLGAISDRQPTPCLSTLIEPHAYHEICIVCLRNSVLAVNV